ncbi:MAG: hypothetical protein WAN65_03920 [Candidatus Sulfotelmatobacter sp.]
MKPDAVKKTALGSGVVVPTEQPDWQTPAVRVLSVVPNWKLTPERRVFTLTPLVKAKVKVAEFAKKGLFAALPLILEFAAEYTLLPFGEPMMVCAGPACPVPFKCASSEGWHEQWVKVPPG